MRICGYDNNCVPPRAAAACLLDRPIRGAKILVAGSPHGPVRRILAELRELRSATSGETSMPEKRSCFVVMGFGEKTDFQSNPQRILNLDKTFDYIIQPIVEECGRECIRA